MKLSDVWNRLEFVPIEVPTGNFVASFIKKSVQPTRIFECSLRQFLTINMDVVLDELVSVVHNIDKIIVITPEDLLCTKD